MASIWKQKDEWGFPLLSPEHFYFNAKKERGELDGAKVSSEAGFMDNEIVIIAKDGEEKRMKRW